jgi:hypothetical protein
MVGLALTMVAAGVAAVASVVQGSKRPEAVTATPPAATTVTIIQAPPADRSILWFGATDSSVLRATDWNGRVVGSLSLSCNPCGVLASPDGQRLLIGYQIAPGPLRESDRVYDARGRLLATVDGFQSQWSDDSRNLCAVRGQPGSPSDTSRSGAAYLEVIDTTNGATRRVASLATGSGPGLVSSWSVVGCSARNDRGVAVYSNGGVQAVRVVSLTTGRTLLSRSDAGSGQTCTCRVGSMVVSGNGMVAAENLANSGDALKLDLASGRESAGAASWAGRGPVIGLSWDGRLAVTPLGVYTFPEGLSLWQAQLPAYLQPLSSEPYSDAVLLSLWVSSAPAGRPVIVRSDGRADNLPPSYLSQPPLPF